MRPWSFVVAVLGLAACSRPEPYQQCAYNQPCGSDAPLCLSNTTSTGRNARFCTVRCNTPAASSSECPGDGACVQLNGMDRVCMKRCTAAADCDFENATCAALPESMGARVCTTRP